MNFVSSGYSYGGQQSVRSSPTILLIFVNIAVFILMLISGDIGDCNSLVCEVLVQQNRLVFSGFYWPLFTSMFVHFGPLHLIFNMFGLYYFGRLNETQYSTTKLLAIYFMSGIFGNIMTLFLLAPATVSGGASGAIFGLVGSYVAIARRAQHMGAALTYALFIFIQSSLLPGVNIFAHLFGLISGLGLGLLFSPKRAPPAYSVSYTYPS